jgi:peroxiredoxin
VGDPIPNATLFELDDNGAPRAIAAAKRFAGKRVGLFAVPGAYTRTCSEKHLPTVSAQAWNHSRGGVSGGKPVTVTRHNPQRANRPLPNSYRATVNRR